MTDKQTQHPLPNLPERVAGYLRDRGLADQAHQAAPQLHDEALEVASWVLAMGEDYLLLVLPAAETPAADMIQAEHARTRLAAETEIERLFPDCDPRTIPPFGPAYGLPVYASERVLAAALLRCPTGRTNNSLVLSRAHFNRLCRPARPPGSFG